MLNEIVQGDARELLKDLPSASVDLIFTSPPYGNAGCIPMAASNLISTSNGFSPLPSSSGASSSLTARSFSISKNATLTALNIPTLCNLFTISARRLMQILDGLRNISGTSLPVCRAAGGVGSGTLGSGCFTSLSKLNSGCTRMRSKLWQSLQRSKGAGV